MLFQDHQTMYTLETERRVKKKPHLYSLIKNRYNVCEYLQFPDSSIITSQSCMNNLFSSLRIMNRIERRIKIACHLLKKCYS